MIGALAFAGGALLGHLVTAPPQETDPRLAPIHVIPLPPTEPLVVPEPRDPTRVSDPRVWPPR